MAASLSVRTVPDHQTKLIVADLTLDAAYPTGGYSLTPSQFGLLEIWALVPIGGTAPAGIIPHYDFTARKLKLFGGSAASQGAFNELAANSAVVSATTVLRLLAIGY